MVRVAGKLIEKHIIAGTLGGKLIVEILEADLQAWLNEYVNTGASRSLLKVLLLHIRAIFKHARKKKMCLRIRPRISEPRARSGHPSGICR